MVPRLPGAAHRTSRRLGETGIWPRRKGRAFEAATADELTGVYRTIGRSVETVEVHREVMEWFLAAGFVLVMAAGGLSLLWFSRLP